MKIKYNSNQNYLNRMHKCVALVLFWGLYTGVLMAQSSGPGPFTLNAPAGSTNWQWYFNGAAISGETNMTFDAEEEGVYYVEYDESITGCTDFFGTYSVIIAATSSTATSLVGPTGYSGYQWTKDGGDVAGETNSSLLLTNEVASVGTYTLKYTTPACELEYGEILVYVLSCDAGDAAPILDMTSVSNNCPATTADLTSINATNTPSGTIALEFHSAADPTDNTTLLADATMVGAGTYYATFHDTANDCYSPSTEVSVTIDVCPTCDAGTNAPNLSSTTSMTTCPEGTADISGITADNNPGGLALQWHTAANPTDNTTLIADVTMLAPGTYYAVFFDATDGGCYSPSASFIITLMDCCMAGNAAPTYDASVPTAFCDAISQDLDEYTTDTPPSGTVLTWSTNSDPLVTADHLASSVVTTAGTYYGFFYDATNTCASPTLQVALSLTTSPDAGMNGSVAACSDVNNGTTTVDLDDALGGTPDAGNWSITTDPSNGSVSIGAGNVVDFNGLANGIYVFTYTVSAFTPCTDATSTVSVAITACDGSCEAQVRPISFPNN